MHAQLLRTVHAGVVRHAGERALPQVQEPSILRKVPKPAPLVPSTRPPPPPTPLAAPLHHAPPSPSRPSRDRRRAAQARREVRLEAVGGVPGEYTGRASRAYEYYADDCVAWVPSPLAVTVEPATPAR